MRFFFTSILEPDCGHDFGWSISPNYSHTFFYFHNDQKTNLFQASSFHELHKLLHVGREELGLFEGGKVATARHDLVRQDVLELVPHEVFGVHEEFLGEEGHSVRDVGRDSKNEKKEQII